MSKLLFCFLFLYKMIAEKYLEEMKAIQKSFLQFLDEDNEENFNNLKKLIEGFKILENKQEIKSFLYLISNIAENHHRGPNFFKKIERVLQHFKKDIINNFLNFEIFNIFSQNKRILLFLIEGKILTVDEYVAKKMTRIIGYDFYFWPEISIFKNKRWFYDFLIKQHENQNRDKFYELRKLGENHNLICQLIREDSIDEFIRYVNQNVVKLDSEIPESIYETNNFIKGPYSHVSLIKYAAFCGSIQIFNYLKINGVELNESLWNYAIHSHNSEIIRILEEQDFKSSVSFKKLIKTSIKCHHNDIANYLIENYLPDINLLDFFKKSIQFYNFEFIQDKFITESSLHFLCLFDYYILVEFLLKNKDVDVNKKLI